MKNTEILADIIKQKTEQEEVYFTYNDFIARVNEIKKEFQWLNTNHNYHLLKKVRIAFDTDEMHDLQYSNSFFTGWAEANVPSIEFYFNGSVYVAGDWGHKIDPVKMSFGENPAEDQPYVNITTADGSALSSDLVGLYGEFIFVSRYERQM